ncbi:MAG TPA: glycosyltransferase [Bacteroidota bacterium]
MTEPHVRISVVVPTLNEEKLLGRMLGQFTPELCARHALEVIVSDGGSADATLEIARRHAVTLLENSDGGRQTISLGRNLGAAVAQGAVLVFLNADTLLDDRERFFARIGEMQADPALVALTCSVNVFPWERRRSDRWFHGFFNWLFSMMNSVGMAMGRGECHVIRKSAFEAVGGYSASIAAGEDYDLFRRLGSIGKVRFLKDLTVYESPRRYRQYGYGKVMASWFVNFLWVSLLHRSVAQEWEAVR